jgi:hypothetical protein
VLGLEKTVQILVYEQNNTDKINQNCSASRSESDDGCDICDESIYDDGGEEEEEEIYILLNGG